jgi:hypothetical protein
MDMLGIQQQHQLLNKQRQKTFGLVQINQDGIEEMEEKSEKSENSVIENEFI